MFDSLEAGSLDISGNKGLCVQHLFVHITNVTVSVFISPSATEAKHFSSLTYVKYIKIIFNDHKMRED